MLPNDEPLRRREALRRCAPNMQMLAIESKMPNTRPGKKPTSTAPTGNFSQCSVSVVFPVMGEDEEVVVGLAVDEGEEDFVADGLLEPDVEATAGAMLWSVFLRHRFALVQLYPNGQQVLLPHTGRDPLRAEVFSGLSGCSDTFC